MKKIAVVLLSIIFLNLQTLHAFCLFENQNITIDELSCHQKEPTTSDKTASCTQKNSKCCATVIFLKPILISTCEKIDGKIYSAQNLLDTSVIIQLYKPPKIS